MLPVDCHNLLLRYDSTRSISRKKQKIPNRNQLLYICYPCLALLLLLINAYTLTAKRDSCVTTALPYRPPHLPHTHTRISFKRNFAFQRLANRKKENLIRQLKKIRVYKIPMTRTTCKASRSIKALSTSPCVPTKKEEKRKKKLLKMENKSADVPHEIKSQTDLKKTNSNSRQHRIAGTNRSSSSFAYYTLIKWDSF